MQKGRYIMYINQIFELSMTVDAKNLSPLLNAVLRNSDSIKETEDHLIDCSLEHKGILFLYQNSKYHKKVKVIINADLLLNGEPPNPHRLLQKIKKQLGKYMNGSFCLDQFTLSKVTTITDIHVGNQSKVGTYIKVLRRIGRVKGFTPVEYDCFDKDNSFCLTGNSNHIDFLLYDAKPVLKKYNFSKMNGTITVEVRLNKPSAVRCYCTDMDASTQIISLYEQRAKVFFDTMTRIIPDGMFCKKQDAIDRICRDVKDIRLRRRMIRLVVLVPEKRSLLLAQKALNYRHVDVVMDAFRKIGLSPITIGKRQDEKHLLSLYSYMEE